MSVNDHKVYNTLENPPRVLFWEMDEFLSFAVPFFLSILFGSLFFFISAFVSKYFFKKIKKQFSGGGLIHLMYWNLPKSAFMGKLKNIPESYKRDLLQ